MKKLLSCLLIVLTILTLIVSATFVEEKEKPEPPEEEVNEKDLWVEEQLSEMTIEEKIGQMLIVSDTTTVLDEDLLNNLNTVKPGGFILFSDNIKSYEQTKKLIEDINNTSDIPMFISIDQEGGRVLRIKKLSDAKVTNIPSMYHLGLTKDTKLSYEVGKVVGEELRVFGINMNFAPVLDIYSNKENTVIGDRSFGTTSDLVSKMALSFAEGQESTGIISVYKHFPGHGNTSEDSHYTLPVITKTKEELMNLELKPFIEAINNGADVIMIGHLAVPSITKDDTPASLSKEIITDLLKNELGYNGLVITDALNMDALTNEYTEEEIYINAINAGVDILLMPDFDNETIEIITNAIANGTIAIEEIDNSVEKILELKYDKLFIENPYTKEYLGSTEHQEIISRIPSY